MVICLKWSDVVSFLLALLFVVSAVPTAVRSIGRDDAVKEVSSVLEGQSASEKLLVYLFLDAIREQSNLFYKPYYTVNPTVAYYFTAVKEIKETGANTYITFSMSPYIGPHDTIGEDEVTFRVDHSGRITAEEFRHLKSYSLPDQLSHIEKGELPPLSE